MSVRGTHFTALASSEVVPSEHARVFAIARDLPDWADTLVDRTLPHLAPPESLENARSRVEDAADTDGVDNALAISWESTGFETRFRSYLQSSGAREVLSQIQSDASQRPVWLVSWRSDDRYDHRRIVLEELQRRTQDGPCAEGRHEWRRGSVVGALVCDICGYSSQSVTDWHGQVVRVSYGGDRQ
ncbi:hypothetical protein C5C07_14005 [Haloferax sp. Atlit-4N]|uniref:hypothetical protein n=1 Tax=Haloferax sp. Atlit-4N TaxID=2077206 RepID=UPI000E25CF0E|nr:hypothetical protein [Haloferax sp. Atlit-4N]RDZ52866.1 hypothetical protein C5C07_14005 [Haloferax sp. Atlit-4N]